MSSRVSSVAGRILHNSFWYGIETIIETFVFLGSSVAVARYLGPTKLGYFSYINFFVVVVTRTSGTGMANAARKYMSEALAQDRPGLAHAVYRLAYRYQLLGACAITALSLAFVFLFGDPAYRMVSVLLIVSIIPGIMSWVPANANLAFEDASKNTFSAFCYLLTYAALITLTVRLHWDLVGVASALLVGRTVEVVLRTVPLHARLRVLGLEPVDAGLVTRIRRFCLESMGIQLLMAIVWDRSEMVFLKAYCGLEQIAFYSVSFGLASNLLVIPRTFGSATGISLMVESGRDSTRVRTIIDASCRYLLLIAIPTHLGAAAVTRSALGLAYGAKYMAAVPVLMIASVLAIPRAFQELPEILLKAADKQKQLLIWFSITGALNIALDWLLIPRYGAVGAAWGNGLSQTFGIVAIWQRARHYYPFRFPVPAALRLLAAGLGMAGVAYLLSHHIPGLAGLVLAVVTAVPVYMLLVKVVHGLEPEDRVRFQTIAERLPGPARRVFEAVISFATPAPAVERGSEISM